MKRALLMAALMLGGCEHMYGAGDVGFTDAQVVKLAGERLGVEQSIERKVCRVIRQPTYYFVSCQEPDPNTLDGGVYVRIDRRTHRMLDWSRDG